MILKFNWKYFLATILLFSVEVIIATLLKDLFFIRAYFGDVLVVILVYTFVLSFFKIRNKLALVLGVFLFAVFIEILQLIGIADILNLKPGSVARIVVGSSFSWWDILCYFVGCLSILGFNAIKKGLSKP